MSTDSHCLEMLERKYKFYLSFENAVCEDYITEKFFKVLNYNLVPIVLGGANYSKFAPPNSFIDVRNFKSVAKLAKYLNFLDKNETAYAEYFEWKKYFRVVVDYKNVFCHLCEVLLSQVDHLIYFFHFLQKPSWGKSTSIFIFINLF